MSGRMLEKLVIMSIHWPETIFIDMIPYQVDTSEMAQAELSGGELSGHIYPSQTWIRVDKTLPPIRQIQVLMHEVVHGICFEMHEKDLCNNEVFVDQFGRQLYQFITQNPELIKIIQNGGNSE